MKWSGMDMKNKKWYVLFWALMYVGVLLVLSQGGYSDGDDAYFYKYTHSMGFFEYLGWRYETWVGRMAAEALVYIAFRFGLGFWRVVNALMLVLLPMGVLRLAAKAARVPQGSLIHWHDKSPACPSFDYRDMGFGPMVAVVAGYFMMSAMTLGYAAVWVNGSIFYTWCFTCGIWALMPFADFVFSAEPYAGKGAGGLRFSLEGVRLRMFLGTVPCAVIAAMSIEQMGAVLLVFEVLAVVYGILKWRRIHPLLAAQTCVTLLAFVILFAAPGNDIRVASEVTTWMPQFDMLSVGEHLFITAHWLLSSFANENKLFLCGIWVVGMLLILQKEKCGPADGLCIAAAGIFTVAALLPYAGVYALSEMGMSYLNASGCVMQVPVWSNMTSGMNFAMAWWFAALLFTFVFLWRVSGCQITLLLSYLAGLASEAIMYFSPTMYASGARVYYLTDILYLFVILSLSFGLRKKRARNLTYGMLAVFAVINFADQLPTFLGQM